MKDSFRCSICGEVHDGLTTDWAYTLPDVVWEIPEDERTKVARFNKDLCQMGEHYFIRCMLEVPFKNSAGYFGWGVWAEVSWPVFERYFEIYDEDGSSEPQAVGLLANELSPYAGSVGTPVTIRFRDPKNRPTLHLNKDNSAQLALDQRLGIDEARYHEILSIVGT